MEEAVSPRLVEAIKRFEGFHSLAYRDPAEVWTIGYGRTSNVKPDQMTTEEQEERWLRVRLEEIAHQLKPLVKREMTAGQRDAFMDFVYNLGLGAFRKSTLLRKFNAGDIPGAAWEFERWTLAGGRILPGLLSRRVEEKAWFLESLVKAKEQ
jgi:lysozyme